MKVVYANQSPPRSWSSAIFLAGPTPRTRKDIVSVQSWRPDALNYLKQIGYDGVVFVPEDEHGKWQHSYDDQIEWEDMCLNFADVIIFWIPRELELMPAFTTNDEWGFWKARDPMKLVLGTPPEAPKVRYQRYYAKKNNIPIEDSLEATCQAAIDKIGRYDGIMRCDGERYVPLHIWQTSSFQNWYDSLKSSGNRLDGAEVEWVLRSGFEQDPVFLWVLHVDVYITIENRNKSNEVIIGRPDISTILLYERRHPLHNSRIALVQEMRSAVSNSNGYVLELAGGSSINNNHNSLGVALAECEEEVNLRLSSERVISHQSRQIAATVLTHKAHLFSSELTCEEMNRLAESPHIVNGIEADTERTQVRVMTYGELMENNDIDWSMLGMIASVLCPELIDAPYS